MSFCQREKGFIVFAWCIMTSHVHLIMGTYGSHAGYFQRLGSRHKRTLAPVGVDFFDQSNNNPVSWQWLFPGGVPSFSTDQNPTNICYNDPGIYDITLITTGPFGGDTLILSNYITVNPTPAFPVITQNGLVLTSTSAVSYQWQLNSLDIPGATAQSYIVTQTGFYTVVTGDSNGCVNSATLYVLLTGIDGVLENAGLSIYPNPSNGKFILEFIVKPSTGNISLYIVNTLGQEVFSSLGNSVSEYYKKEIDLGQITPGVYELKLKTSDICLSRRIVIH